MIGCLPDCLLVCVLDCLVVCLLARALWLTNRHVVVVVAVGVCLCVLVFAGVYARLR